MPCASLRSVTEIIIADRNSENSVLSLTLCHYSSVGKNLLPSSARDSSPYKFAGRRGSWLAQPAGGIRSARKLVRILGATGPIWEASLRIPPGNGVTGMCAFIGKWLWAYYGALGKSGLLRLPTRQKSARTRAGIMIGR